jgi:hypothetical protein
MTCKREGEAVSSRHRFTLSVGVVVAALVIQIGLHPGCAPRDGGRDASGKVRAEYDDAGVLRRLLYDGNQNGKTETIAHMNGAQIAHLELDTDENGVIDRWEYYKGERVEKVGVSTANDGVVDMWSYRDAADQLVKIELSPNRDGKIGRTEFYGQGALLTAEEDTDLDGRIDKWESFRDGAIASVAFDLQGRGKPDRRVVYTGGVAHVEVDPDGNGTFEPLAAPAESAPPGLHR